MRAWIGAGVMALALSSASAQDYRPPSDVPGEGQSEDAAAALTLRIERLEGALRRATGQIEELQNENHKLADQMRRLREDMDARASGKTGAAADPAPVAMATPQPTHPPKRTDAFDPEADPSAPGSPKPLGSTAPSAPLTLPSHQVDPAPFKPLPTPPPTKPASADDAPPTFVASSVPFGDAKEQFKAAVTAYKAGQYADAEGLFKAYLEANKGAANASEAIFYIGETYMQRSRPREAAEQYLKVSTEYSKSAIAPQALVRLGLALAGLGNTEQACATFAEVGRRYPGANASVKKSADRESQKLRCT